MKSKLKEVAKSQKVRLGALGLTALFCSLGLISLLNSSFDDSNPVTFEKSQANPRVRPARVKLNPPKKTETNQRAPASNQLHERSASSFKAKRYSPPKVESTTPNLPASRIQVVEESPFPPEATDQDYMENELRRELATEEDYPEEQVYPEERNNPGHDQPQDEGFNDYPPEEVVEELDKAPPYDDPYYQDNLPVEENSDFQ